MHIKLHNDVVLWKCVINNDSNTVQVEYRQKLYLILLNDVINKLNIRHNNFTGCPTETYTLATSI